MSKRFTDTEKWKKKWIRQLGSKYKLFWVFLCDDCNHAGIWDVDMEVANIRLGLDLTEEDVLKVFKDKIISIDTGNKWFIPKFVEFQYGNLNPDNRVHSSVLNILDKEGASKPLIRAIQGRKDKAKDKDKVKDKEKKLFNEKTEFDLLMGKYPNNDGKKAAFVSFKASVKTKEDLTNINRALDNYLRSKNVKEGFIKNASTWFNNWTDWTNEGRNDVTSGLYRE